MEPDKYKKRKILFNYFEIKGIEIVDKFVQKKKEKYEFKKYNIKSLSDGDYLFKQEHTYSIADKKYAPPRAYFFY